MAVIAAGATWVWLAFRPKASAPAPHPADALDPREAFVTGGKFGTAGRHIESIPYFRRATVGMGELWEGRFNLAAALANAALEVEPRLGRIDPALRSSFERIQTVLDGMAEARHALRIARDGRARAYTAYQDAQLLQAWGFPWDALATARAAQQYDPGWEPPRRLVNDLQRDLARGGMTP